MIMVVTVIVAMTLRVIMIMSTTAILAVVLAMAFRRISGRIQLAGHLITDKFQVYLV